MKKFLPLLSGECFWGGSAASSLQMPYNEKSEFVWDMRTDGIQNQTMPLLISNKGRYVWSETPFAFSFSEGVLQLDGDEFEIVQAGDTLKEAYLAAMEAHFPFDGKQLPDIFFQTAQYNGWMQFMYEPTQDGVLDYCRNIVKHGFVPGVIMIDEGWQKDYGTWEFDGQKFPDPKAMVDELHAMGFRVMLWIVPYVGASGYHFQYYTRFHPDHGELFMRTTDNQIAITCWWNGYTAVLDMTREADRRFLDTQLRWLMDEYGIDGFKFDGGATAEYRDCCVVNGAVSQEATAEERNMAWNEFGRQYVFHEYKDSYRQGGRNMIQRLSDRCHTWWGNGINTVIPSSLVQGLLGTPFICPDMIGGGEWSSFRFYLNSQVDQELFVRMAQCSALLPMMQFSLAPWQYLNEKNLSICVEMSALHRRMAPYILKLVRASERSGEPIVQHLAYAFPQEGFEYCSDCFMLGDKYLVAPVLEQGVTQRTLRLPAGTWRYIDGEIYVGGETITVPAPLEVLPYFESV